MRRFALLLILATASCDSKTPDEQPAPEPAPKVTEVEPQPEPELPDPIPDAEIQAVFDAWIASQNEQNFERYSSLFADKFEGIRRTGPRTYRFGREGWLKDRGRMFKKPMTVTADDVQIAATDRTASVTFVQTWASGTYKDVGPKQLLIVKSGDDLRIAREEMVESNISGADQRPTYAPDKFALVTDGAIVLDLAPKKSWAKGPVELISRPTSAKRGVSETGYEEWLGREVVLFGPTGEVCRSKVDAIELRALVNPHFGTVQHWNGEDGGTPIDDRTVAAEIWRTAQGLGNGVRLFGRLETADGCKTATWARPADGAARPLPMTDLTGDVESELVQAFTDLPGFHATQEDFDKAGYRGAWHLDESAQRSYRAFGDWVFATATAGMGCGDFEGALWAIWKRADSGLELSSSEDGQQYFAPSSAAEVGDATYFIGDDRVLGRVGDAWTVVWDARMLDLDCGC